MSSNVTDLDEHKSVEQLKRELISLKRENVAAMKTIEKLLKDLHKKTEDISHLQSLVSQTVPVVKKDDKKSVEVLAPEEEIADLQLERLRLAAKARTLTLEETRMYDLLVKNKRLSQDESTINLSKANYRDVTEVELLQVAAQEVKFTDESDSE